MTTPLPEPQRLAVTRAIEDSDTAARRKRSVIVTALRDGASYRAMSEATGISTNTLQRWLREER